MKMISFKGLFIVLFTLFFGANISAQVTIGDDVSPTKGIVLDLKKSTDSGYVGGLRLPHVDIKDLGKIPVSFTDYPSILSGMVDDCTDDNTCMALKGTVVYNNGTTTQAGIYMWNGESWDLLTTYQENKIVLSPKPSTISQNGEIIKFIASNAGCTVQGEYVFINLSNPSLVSLSSSSSDGEFNVDIKYNQNSRDVVHPILVTDPCGNSSIFAFKQEKINVIKLPEYVGDGIRVDGMTYFDVAMSNDNDECGRLASRYDYLAGKERFQYYDVVGSDVNKISNLVYYIVDTDMLTQAPGLSISSTEYATASDILHHIIEFKMENEDGYSPSSGVNKLVQGTTWDNPKVVTLYVLFTLDGVRYKKSVEIKLADCAYH